MQKNKSLGVIYHSTISKKNNKFFIKDVFANYLKELSEAFKITLYSPIVKHKDFHSSELNSNIRIIIIPKNIFKKIVLLIRSLYNNDIFLIYLPTRTGILAGFIYYIFKKKYYCYIGANLKEIKSKEIDVLNYMNIHKKLIKYLVVIESLLLEKISEKSNGLIVAGYALYDSYSKRNSNIILTKPIINYTLKDISRDIRDFNKKTEIRLLFIGSVYERKGINELIEALKFLNQNDQLRYILDIVGDGEISYYSKIVKRYNLQENVIFHGYIKSGKNLKPFYDNADIFVLPSHSEGFPRVIYEAFIYGLPVITTPVGGIPYVLKDKTHAVFVRIGNYLDLVEKIKLLANSTELMKELSSNGKEFIQKTLNMTAAQQHKNFILNEE